MFDLHPMRALFLMSKSGFKPPVLKEKTKWSADFHNFVKVALTKNPKKRPPAVRLLQHSFLQGIDFYSSKYCHARNEITVDCYKIGHHLTRRLALELLQQVKNPHTPQRSDSMSEADEDLSIGAAPQRIASKRTKSEVFSKLPHKIKDLERDQAFMIDLVRRRRGRGFLWGFCIQCGSCRCLAQFQRQCPPLRCGIRLDGQRRSFRRAS